MKTRLLGILRYSDFSFLKESNDNHFLYLETLNLYTTTDPTITSEPNIMLNLRISISEEYNFQ